VPEVEKNQRFVVVCRLIKCSIKLEDILPLIVAYSYKIYNSDAILLR